MKKKLKMPLALQKQTLRDLSADELKQVPGGGASNVRCTGSNACTIPTTSATCPM